MKQEDKKLLLKDLCARLPYGIKCKDQYGEYIDVNIYNAHLEHLVDQIVSGVVQMVIRPIPSMTEKEKCEFNSYYNMFNNNPVGLIDWLNTHHFDYRGLIEKGLAIEVTEENNPYKK